MFSLTFVYSIFAVPEKKLNPSQPKAQLVANPQAAITLYSIPTGQTMGAGQLLGACLLGLLS